MTTAPVKLYSPEILALAADLADYPWDATLALIGRARSRSCGSSLELCLGLDANEAIAQLGMRTQACAIGQASAAIFARSATGRNRDDLALALAGIEAWLRGNGPQPGWPGLATIAPALAYPARHGAIVLPWQAALDALPS